MMFVRIGAARGVGRAAAACAILSLGLAGCAGGGLGGVDSSDACGNEHAAYADAQSTVVKDIVTGAALGAIVGTITGNGAKEGAAGGAALGSGFAVPQNDDGSVNADGLYAVEIRAGQETDRVSSAFVTVRNCRFQQVDQIKAAVRGGKTPRDQGASQIADHKRRMDDEVSSAQAYSLKLTTQIAAYRQASDQLLEDDSDAADYMQSYRPATRGGPVTQPGDYVATATVNLREEATGSSPKIGSVRKGETVHVTEIHGNWSYVEFDDGTGGYVASRFLAGGDGDDTDDAAQDNIDVKVAIAARYTLPGKLAAFGNATNEAANRSRSAFAL
jgi:hypothetical protein